jgi:hypothetical protein
LEEKKSLTKKQKRGRYPKISVDELFDKLLACAKKGLSIRASLAECGLGHSYLYDLLQRKPELIERMKIIDAEREKFYTNLGLALATGQIEPKNGQNVNVSAYIWLTKNILGWSDKTEIKQEVNSVEEKKIIYKTEWGSNFEVTDFKKLEDE